jgi:hypothetical protein
MPTPSGGGGDFNLIRGAEDKNNDNINYPRILMFNDYIVRLALRELKRTGQTSRRTLSAVFWTGSSFLLSGRITS